MKIHEYQAKELFRKKNIPTPTGGVATSIGDVLKTADALKGFPVVIKAQIHAGGRGKGGGVKLAANRAEAEQFGAEILGKNLVTPQTGPEGQPVSKVLVEEGLAIGAELYLSILPDRSTSQIMVMASRSGGMDIEEVAANSPDAIVKVLVNPLSSIQPYHLRAAAFGLGLEGSRIKEFGKLLNSLYAFFIQFDCSLVEINPLVITEDGRFIALDAKVTIDDNSLYRHKDLIDLRDETMEAGLEVEARKHNLNYIALDGNVGNMVNGAGLAMATMDIIKQAGAEPANFLDVGGGASAEMVENGFKIIQSDPKVRCILVNIFGGILRCDVLAEGVVQAAGKTGLKMPVIVRMEGTNVNEGRRILKESGLNLVTAESLHDAASKVAEAVNQ